jgi:hypothetical protein
VKTGTDEPIEYFQSILAAAQYASENLGCSLSGMRRNHKSKGYEIKFNKV